MRTRSSTENFAGSAEAAASESAAPASKPVRAEFRLMSVLSRCSGKRAELLPRVIQVGKGIGLFRLVVPSAAGERGLDDPVHPRDEVGGVAGCGRRRRAQVDRARRRVGIKVEHPGIRFLVVRAQQDPAAGSEGYFAAPVKARAVALQPESLDDASVLNELEPVHREWRAQRYAHGTSRLRSRQRIAGPLAVDRESEQRSVADERAATLQRV